MPAKSIQLSAIRIDGGTQSREALNQATVAEYAEAMTEGATFPPITLFFDGSNHWLADGFHRYFAAKQVGFTDMPAEVRDGTQLDAQWASYTVNKDHGLRRSNADKRKAVMGALAHPYGKAKSDNQIAKELGVHHSTVGDIRRSLAESASDAPAERTYTTKHGTTAVMKTDKIGKAKPAAKPAAPAPAPAKAAPAPAPLHVVAPTGDVITEADLHEDPADLLEELQRDNEELQKQIAILTAEDTKAELHKMILQRDHAVRQQSEAMDKAVLHQKFARRLGNQVKECCDILGVDDPRHLVSTLRKLVAQQKEAA